MTQDLLDRITEAHHQENQPERKAALELAGNAIGQLYDNRLRYARMDWEKLRPLLEGTTDPLLQEAGQYLQNALA